MARQLSSADVTTALGFTPVATGGINQTAGQFWASPTSGSGPPSFRAIAAGDIAGALSGTALSSSTALATGSTTARTLGAWFGDVANVKAFGATGKGTTLDSAAIQAAAASLINGGCLYLPFGSYLINAAILLNANTFVYSESATIIAAPRTSWNIVPAIDCSAFTNVNYSATTITDKNIRIEGLIFDYQSQFGSTGGADHIIAFQRAQNIIVRDCLFFGAGDATAMQGCYNTLVEDCGAYGFSNCAYDHWAGANTGSPTGPMNARVIGCYAESSTTNGQMINFNPEFSQVTGSAGNAAIGFVMTGCELVGTGASAIPCQLEPLAAGTTVQNVTVTGNIFKNVYLATRGGTRGLTVAGNDFVSIAGGNSAIMCYPQFSANPDAINFNGNTITDPTTNSAAEGVIRIDATNAVINGNIISGTQHYAAVYFGNAAGGTAVISGNQFAHGLNGYQITGPGTWVTSTHGIEGTVIGDQTPAAGSFTNVTAASQSVTGVSMLGNAADVSSPSVQFSSNGGFPLPQSGGALGWNHSAGGQEVDFWNTATSASTGFRWYQQTGASAATLLASLSATGILSVAGALLGTGAPSTNLAGVGALPYMPVCAGAPTGAPTAQTGFVPFVFDSTDSKLWVYTGGVWKGVVVS